MIAPINGGISKHCLVWCGRLGCECSRRGPWTPAPNLDLEGTTTPSYENLDQDGKIHFIRELDKFDVYDLEKLIGIIETEPNDLVRAIARATLEGLAVDIVKHFIQRELNQPSGFERDISE